MVHIDDFETALPQVETGAEVCRLACVVDGVIHRLDRHHPADLEAERTAGHFAILPALEAVGMPEKVELHEHIEQMRCDPGGPLPCGIRAAFQDSLEGFVESHVKLRVEHIVLLLFADVDLVEPLDAAVGILSPSDRARRAFAGETGVPSGMVTAEQFVHTRSNVQGGDTADNHRHHLIIGKCSGFPRISFWMTFRRDALVSWPSKCFQMTKMRLDFVEWEFSVVGYFEYSDCGTRLHFE